MRLPFRRRPGTELAEKRQDSSSLSWMDYVAFFSYAGTDYPILNQSLGGEPEQEIGTDYSGLAQGAYKRNGIVFACVMVRQLVFQEARFKFRTLQSGRPGEYFGSPALRALEEPWPGGTTGDLLARALNDVDLAGNFYGVVAPDEDLGHDGVRRLHPQFVSILFSSKVNVDRPRLASDVRIEGYGYRPPDGVLEVFGPDEVIHFAPYPDPEAIFRGMSWLNPVVSEIMGDNAATRHKLKFFEQGATANFVVKFDPSINKEAVDQWIAAMEDQIGGVENAYRTLYLGGGADAKTVGANLKEVDFKQVQGAGETRIAAAGGTPPIIVGLSEGLESATYSNYSQARRRFADGTMRPLWRNFAGSASAGTPRRKPLVVAGGSKIHVPRAAELWYDDRDIPFLAEDQKDAAEVLEANARTIKALTEAGYEPGAVIDAVTSGDLKRLSHTGLFSVQLQAPGSNPPAPALPPGEEPPTPPPPPSRALVRRTDRLPAAIGGTDKNPSGEAGLRSSAAAFDRGERDIRALVRLAIGAPIEERRAREEAALGVLEDLRGEPVDDHLQDAYSDAFESALAVLDGKEPRAEVDPNVAELAKTLRSKLADTIDVADHNVRAAFANEITEDSADELADSAVVGHIDSAERRWTLSAYASNQISTLGRRATSRGVKNATGGGTVKISEHGSTHPICSQLEGQEFPAFAAPEPPFHDGCEHYLVPVT